MYIVDYFKKEPKSPFFKNLGRLLKENKTAKIIELILVFLAAFIIISVFVSKDATDLVYNQAVIWVANIIMLTLVFAGIKLRGEGLDYFGIHLNKMTWKASLTTLWQSFVVLLLVVAGFVIGSIIMANITGIPENSDMSGYAYLQNNFGMLLLTLFGVFIVSSFGEEIIYRAFLINRISELGLNSKMGKTMVVLISAVIFGLVHYSWGPMGIVQTAFMGLALGISYLFLKKKIWVLVLAHVYMDTILMVQLYFS
jgi:membrane protease YdiL (CAAX protease family)